jgi:CARDB protein
LVCRSSFRVRRRSAAITTSRRCGRTSINADSRGKSKGYLLHVDALLGAKAVNPGLNLDAFEGFVIVINGMPGRGQSGLHSEVTAEGKTVKFAETKGIIWLPSHTSAGNRTTWGRKAHELGHWFDMPDIYTEWFENGTVKTGDAEFWDLAGQSGQGALFSGRQADHMRLFDAANIARRRWLPSIPPGPEEFEIAAHGASEDTGSRIHLLELQVTDSMSYYVEVRQKPGAVIFDQNIPIPAGSTGRVLVTRVDEQQSISNTFERPTMLFGVLDTGQSVVDAARVLRIEAGAVTQANPLTYKVIVHWNEVPPENPEGRYDLRIEPWSTETWETRDIWVNSPRNDKGGPPLYDSHEPGDETRPTLNGDKPWVKHGNTIFARVTNSGGEEAKDVYVTCYVNSPPGIGDNGSWETLKTEKIDTIAANTSQVVSFNWTPAVDKHTCISVAIYPQTGERSPKNNRAQENVAKFDSAGASSHEPVLLEAMVRSPFSVWRRVDLRVRGLPVGWHAVVDQAWAWLPPKGTAPVTGVIWTDLNSSRARHDRIPSEAFARVEGWTDFATHRYLPIGGILAAVRGNKRTRLMFEVRTAPSRVEVLAWLQPVSVGRSRCRGDYGCRWRSAAHFRDQRRAGSASRRCARRTRTVRCAGLYELDARCGGDGKRPPARGRAAVMLPRATATTYEGV